MKYCMKCHKRIWFFQKMESEAYNQIIMNREAFRIVHQKCSDVDMSLIQGIRFLWFIITYQPKLKEPYQSQLFDRWLIHNSEDKK